MAIHMPSLFVGVAFAGTSFLLVHQQLSYRERLSWKWKLRESLEAQYESMRPSAGAQTQEKNFEGSSTSLRKTWNRGINFLQDSLSRK
ncbi:hypothetical protein MPSEU_000368500 [Mayamaea pseudoterrestris]|nr:hypothetical protein MPSEU_000368500 [Mayamaea pseudoterrestris]